MSQKPTWQDVRALRAQPPNLAGGGGARQKTFSGSLQQAQELAEAAAGAGYSSKPILMFYSLSQASRAICASRLKADWNPAGHGLSTVESGNDLLEVEVKASKGGSGLFQAVARAVGESVLSGRVSLGELWRAMPEFDSISIPGQEVRPLIVRPAISLDDATDLDAEAPTEDLFLLLDGLPDNANRGDIQEILGRFPTLENAEVASYPTGLSTGLFSDEEDRGGVAYRRVVMPTTLFPVVRIAGVGLRLREQRAGFHAAAPGAVKDRSDHRCVVPVVGQPPEMLGPIASWWVLLLGLSSVARYQPAVWSKALDIDRSPIAVGLEKLLDTALEVLPHYVVEALTAPPQS